MQSSVTAPPFSHDWNGIIKLMLAVFDVRLSERTQSKFDGNVMGMLNNEIFVLHKVLWNSDHDTLSDQRLSFVPYNDKKCLTQFVEK